jgi:hypothetical protein
MRKPLYLLADSTPMFLVAPGEESLLERVRLSLPEQPRAAYLGASNGDDPNYFEIFCAAMDKIGLHQRRHLIAPYSAEDLVWLDRCDLILLSGGDVMRGWQCFTNAGLQQRFKTRYEAGCVLMGISAGAIQMSDFLFGEAPDENKISGQGMGLARCLVDVHDQDRDWKRLRELSKQVPKGTRCVGIPSNGVLKVHPDQTFEASGAPLFNLNIGT